MVVFNPDELPYPHDLQTMKKLLIERFRHFGETFRFTISKEFATKEHYHFYIYFSGLEWDDRTRVWLKRELRRCFDGELRVTKEKVKDKIRAIAYTIKDGDYVTHNMEWWDVSQAKQIAKPKEEQRYKVLIQRYYDEADGKSEKRLTEELLDICVKCYVPIDTERMAKTVRLALLKQKDNSDYKKRIIEQITDKL